MSRQKFTKEVTCPHCDYEDQESYQFFGSVADGVSREIECNSCNKVFEVEMHLTIEYSSTITDCEHHELDFTSSTLLWIDAPRTLAFECRKCFEEFYDWQLPTGKYPRMKSFEFVGKAKKYFEKVKI